METVHHIPKPLNDCVLIDPEPVPDYVEAKGYTHIVVPDAYKHGPQDPPVWGKVLSMGSGCTAVIHVGDRVVFGKWSYAKVPYHNHLYFMVREQDLLGVDAA